MVFSPGGTHLKDIVFSARNLTCTTWGGKNRDILFITSGMDKEGRIQSKEKGDAGHMFRYHVTTGTKGVAKHEFQG
jgi:sugar lactone lactonase YvrE